MPNFEESSQHYGELGLLCVTAKLTSIIALFYLPPSALEIFHLQLLCTFSHLIHFWGPTPDIQGCAVSRYSLGRAWIEAIFRLGISLGRHIYGCQSVLREEKIHFAYY